MKKYNCSLCPKKYQSENDLKRHMKKIHPDATLPETESQFLIRDIWMNTVKK